MTDIADVLTVSLAALAALAMMVAAALAGWRGWLELERARLGGDVPRPSAPSPAGARIELADLRERVRKLEAIAAGIDL